MQGLDIQAIRVRSVRVAGAFGPNAGNDHWHENGRTGRSHVAVLLTSAWASARPESLGDGAEGHVNRLKDDASVGPADRLENLDTDEAKRAFG